MVLALALTIGCLITEVVCGILKLPYPYDWPLMPKEDPFRDFYLYQPRYRFFHSPAFFSFPGPEYMYPAPLAVVYRIFYCFPVCTWVFLGFVFASFLGAAYILARSLALRGISKLQIALFLQVAFLSSYAFFFEFEQANIEIVIWVMVAVGVWTFLRGRGYSSATCFGIAGSMKIFPLVFVGLFVARRQYRQVFTAFLACGISTILSLWLVCPNLAASWRGTKDGISSFRKEYMLMFDQVGFDHSIFGLSKQVLLLVHHLQFPGLPSSPAPLVPMLAIYLPTVAVLGVLLYFLFIWKLPVINQVVCLTVASILLPPVSYDYTLMHLYIPWAMLVLFAVDSGRQRIAGLSAAFLCLAVLLSPETEFILYPNHSAGGQIKAVALVVLFILGLLYRFPSAFDSGVEDNKLFAR
jgi:hypothetical protein